MTVDRLWYLADEASQQAEQAYHRLASQHDPTLEPDYTRRVSRRRFRTLAERIKQTGTPYGAHTIVYRGTGELLLVRHEGVGLWVLPGGGVDAGESYREAAERELAEEAGVDVRYDGLGMLGRVDVASGDHSTWGVLPVFEAEALTTDPDVTDPDGEISEARWFDTLPEDTRDRDDLVSWRERVF
jgi:8-oxo-dGTP diphosphatase